MRRNGKKRTSQANHGITGEAGSQVYGEKRIYSMLKRVTTSKVSRCKSVFPLPLSLAPTVGATDTSVRGIATMK
jgi:hypothetical protein